eukprot:scaffold24893_cov132-Cylindrotheca_fusiformis.AAC.4
MCLHSTLQRFADWFPSACSGTTSTKVYRRKSKAAHRKEKSSRTCCPWSGSNEKWRSQIFCILRCMCTTRHTNTSFCGMGIDMGDYFPFAQNV